MTKEQRTQALFPFLTSEDHGQSVDGEPVGQTASEEVLDSAEEEFSPARAPVSVTITKIRLPSAERDKRALQR